MASRSSCLLVLTLLAHLALTPIALAQDRPLRNESEEIRAQAIFAQVDCPACETPTIAHSRIPMISDLRQTIRDHITDGKSDAYIYHYVREHWQALLTRQLPDHPLRDDTLEKRAQEIFAQLRCPVCEGQPLKESNSPVATDIRHRIRTLLESGQTDREILDYMASRYGIQVLQKPPLQRSTALLWLAPALFLAVGLAMVLVYFRRNKARGAP